MKHRKNLPELDPDCFHHFEPDESLSMVMDTKGHDHYICSNCDGYKKIRKHNGPEAKGSFFGKFTTTEINEAFDDLQDNHNMSL